MRRVPHPPSTAYTFYLYSLSKQKLVRAYAATLDDLISVVLSLLSASAHTHRSYMLQLVAPAPKA